MLENGIGRDFMWISLKKTATTTAQRVERDRDIYLTLMFDPTWGAWPKKKYVRFFEMLSAFTTKALAKLNSDSAYFFAQLTFFVYLSDAIYECHARSRLCEVNWNQWKESHNAIYIELISTSVNTKASNQMCYLTAFHMERTCLYVWWWFYIWLLLLLCFLLLTFFHLFSALNDPL